MKRHGWLMLALLGTAVLAVAGHVCVVPHAHAAMLHSHAWDGDAASPAPSAHDDQPGGDDALHDASCTALRSAHSAPTPILMTVGVVVPDSPSALASAVTPLPLAYA